MHSTINKSWHIQNKVEILNEMIDKMFIYNENNQYILKIENKATPMSEFIKTKQQDQIRNARTDQEIMKSSEERKDYIRRRERIYELVEMGDDWKDDAFRIERYYVICNKLCKFVAYFIDEPEPENLKPSTSKQYKSQMSSASKINRRLNATISQLGTVVQDSNTIYFETEFVIKDIWKDKLKKVLLLEDLRDYLYGNMNADVDSLHSSNKRDHIIDVICQNIILKNNKLVMTNDWDLTKRENWDFPVTDFTINMTKNKLLEGINLQGVGGTIYQKPQVNNLKQSFKDSQISKELLLNQDFTFSEHVHDVKMYKITSNNSEDPSSTIYILETLEISSPDQVYCCHLNTKSLKGKACRLVLEFFNPKPVINNDQDSNENEIQTILNKYMSYNLVVAVFEQSFPQWIMFHKELSNFFVIDNITFLLFEPNSLLKWKYNIHDVKSYEYFEGDVMYKYVYAIVMGMFETKRYQMLDSNDKIEELTEEISDLKDFDQSSRQFWIRSNIDPDFHIEQARPNKETEIYYTYLASLRENEIRKKKIFYKAYNIGLGEDTELSINMILNVYICSNETVRVSLSLTDLVEKDRQDPVHHVINFIKQFTPNNSKMYSELVRYKNFFFIINIMMCLNPSTQLSGFWVDLSCTTNDDRINSITDDIPSATRLCSILNIDQKPKEAHESSADESGSQSIFNKSSIIPEFVTAFRTWYKPILSLFGSVGEEVLEQVSIYEDEYGDETQGKLLHRKTFYDDTNNLVVVIEIRTHKRLPGGKSFNHCYFEFRRRIFSYNSRARDIS